MILVLHVEGDVSVIRRFVVVLLGGLMAVSTGMAQVDASPAEKALLQMANQFRAEHGVAPLAWDSALARAARLHAKRMVVAAGDMEHQYPGEPDMITRAAQQGAHFGAIAENLAGQGQNPAQLHHIWTITQSHRTNLLNPNMNVVGIGVIESGGLLYAVEDFAHDVPAPRQDEVAGQVVAALQKMGMQSVKSTEEARSNCESQSNTSPGAMLVVHWEGSNPSQLPDVLVQRIAQGTYHSAAVGACPSAQSGQGFTTYRVAVLLY
ncbi:CAP domain-containing protein [Edaphobacter paludis]|uniref:CAP domain-containing protein n=1 Tax=Edaphobacter paludis TaxID=3035702 RepID=A0AAU7D0C8_9BACT